MMAGKAKLFGFNSKKMIKQSQIDLFKNSNNNDALQSSYSKYQNNKQTIMGKKNKVCLTNGSDLSYLAQEKYVVRTQFKMGR